jgi:hypothetical protein
MGGQPNSSTRLQVSRSNGSLHLPKEHFGERLPSRAPLIESTAPKVAPRAIRENLIGDLEEEFRTILVPQYGLRWARFWYRWQVIAVIGPLLWEQSKRIAGVVLLLKWIR